MKTLLFITLTATAIHAQNSAISPKTWTGKPTATLRFEASYDSQKDSTLGKINRAYLGYKAQYEQSWEASVVYDVSPENLADTIKSNRASGAAVYGALLQSAWISWNSSQQEFQWTAGLQPMPNMIFPNPIWKDHYIRSLLPQTLFKSPISDLGVQAKWSPKWNLINTNWTFVTGVSQGGGHKNLTTSLESPKWYLGWQQTSREFGLNHSMYGEVRPQKTLQGSVVEQLYSTHLGWTHPRLKTGIEAVWGNHSKANPKSSKWQASALNLGVNLPYTLEVLGRGEWIQRENQNYDEYVTTTVLQWTPIPKLKMSLAWLSFTTTDAKVPKKNILGTFAEIQF